MDELIKAFSIDRVHKSGSRFDPEKAKWFNHQYLQIQDNTQLAMVFREDLRARGYHFDLSELEILVGMVKERLTFIKDLWNETDFFFSAPVMYDKEVIKKRWKEDTSSHLTELKILLGDITDFSPEMTEQTVKNWIESKGYNTGSILNALRLVIVGTLRGPHLFDIIGWLGKEKTLLRIDRGLSTIGN
jgi:glutamyl-tRNA synthetase